jgi:type I restriction enzyme R subunit
MLYDAKEKIRKYNLFNDADVKKIIDIFQVTSDKQDDVMLGKISSAFRPIRERYEQLEESMQYEFRTLLRGFRDKYNYISQLVRLFDRELLEESIFVNYLITMLPTTGKTSVDISDKVKMDYYKLTKDFEDDISLVKDNAFEYMYQQQKGINPAVKPPEERDTLTEILDKINAQFPDVFTEADRVVLDMVVKQVVQNPDPRQQSMAKENDFSMFKQSLVF